MTTALENAEKVLKRRNILINAPGVQRQREEKRTSRERSSDGREQISVSEFSYYRKLV